MKVVADSSVFLAVVLDEPERQRIIRAAQGRRLSAPEVLPFEIGNALSAMMKRRLLSPAEATAAWDAATRIPVELRSVDIRAALRMAASRAIYAYDAYFLDCALSSGTPLLTLDRGMARVAQTIGVELLEY